MHLIHGLGKFLKKCEIWVWESWTVLVARKGFCLYRILALMISSSKHLFL